MPVIERNGFGRLLSFDWHGLWGDAEPLPVESLLYERVLWLHH